MKKPSSISIFAGILAALAAGLVFAGCSKQSPQDQAGRKVSVVLTPVHKMIFEERIEVSGSVEAKNTALVSARIPGVLDKIFVDEGDPVVTGITELFQTDKANLVKARDSTEQQVNVANEAVAARMATIDRIKADLAKVRLDTERYRRLYNDKNAITKNALELKESELKQVEALLEEANAGIALAIAQKEQAVNSQAIAEKNLTDSLVYSPIDGVVSERILEPGEMANTGTAVLRIVDLSVVEISAFLPEQYYDRIVVEKTKAHLFAGGKEIGEYAITYKSPVIDQKLRTFEIKIRLAPAPAGVVPGRLINMAVIVERHEGLGVPMAAIQKRAGEDIVFLSDGTKVHKVPVRVGLETDEMLEIESEKIAEGAQIVAKGQRFCNDGDEIKIVGGAD